MLQPVSPFDKPMDQQVEASSFPAYAIEDASTCPICDEVSIAATCPRCGWLLFGPMVLGRVSAKERKEFNTRLTNAKLRADLRWLLLASGVPFAIDPQIEIELHDIAIRGRKGSAGSRVNELFLAARESILAELQSELAPSHANSWEIPKEPSVDRVLDNGVSYLTEAQSDERTLALFDLNFEGITHWVWQSDENRLPNATSERPTDTPWTSIVQDLVTNPPLLWRYQLAGGRNRSPLTWSRVREDLSDYLAKVLGSNRHIRVVVLNRLVGWEVSSAAMEALQSHGGVNTEMINADPEMESLHSLVRRALGRVPMSEEYCLVTAHISQAGAVELVHQPLAFAQEQTSAVARANVFMPPFAASVLLLPVLTRKARSREAWRPVAIGSISAGTSMAHATTVKIVRDAPGQIHFTGSNAVSAVSVAEWERARQSLPRHIQLEALRPLDMVCAIEMSGRAELVQPRLDLLLSVLESLRNFEPTGDRVRVTIIGYFDHSLEALDSRDRSEPLRVYGPAGTSEAIRELERWVPPNTQVGQYATSVEDMLHAIAQRTRRPMSSSVLVTIGSRPPYPPRQLAEPTVACPFGRDWESELRAISPSLRRISVVDAPAWIELETLEPTIAHRYSQTWNALGAHGRYELATAVASKLVGRILGETGQRPQLALTLNNQLRIAFAEVQR